MAANKQPTRKWPIPQRTLDSKKGKTLEVMAMVADRLYEIRADMKKAKEAVTDLDIERKALKEHLIQNLPKSKAEGVTGSQANAIIRNKTIPQVQGSEGWDKLYKHIKRTGDFGLLQRRLSEGLIKDYWRDGKKVPGVGEFNVPDVSITKKRK